MKRKSIVWIMVLFCVTGSLFAQTISYLQAIDTSVSGSFTTGIAFHNGNLYVVTFIDRKVLKITNANTASPTVSVFADVSTEATWATGRGLQGIAVNPATGDVFASGDTGSGHCVVKYNSSGTKLASLVDENSTHRNAGCAIWGLDPDLLLTQTGSGLFDVNLDLSGYDTPSYLSGAHAYGRDVCIVGNSIYVSRTAVAGLDGIDEFIGGTAGDLTSYAASTWIDGTGFSSQAASGIYAWNYTSATYICWANVITPGARTLDIYNQSTKALFKSLGSADNVIDPRDSCVGLFGSDSYLFISHGGQNNVLVFGIDGATLTSGIADWSVY
jgi:hypothetical protein